MEITHEQKQGCSIYYFKEKIDIFNSERIKKYLMETIEKENTDKVIFNFKDLSELDSLGIAVLIKTIGKFNEKVNFRFCEAGERVIKALSYTQINSFFIFDKTEADSIVELNKES